MHQGQGESLELDLSMEGESRLDPVTKSNRKTTGPDIIRETTAWRATDNRAGPEVSRGKKTTFTCFSGKCSDLSVKRGTKRVTGGVGTGTQSECLPCRLLSPDLCPLWILTNQTPRASTSHISLCIRLCEELKARPRTRQAHSAA